MSLPKLPKKNKRTEAKIDQRVAKWFYKNHPKSALIEVKMVKGRLTDSQRRLIDKVSRTGKFMYKFPDGGRRTPLDYVILKDADAVLAVCDEKGNCECIVNNIDNYKIKIKV